MILFSGVQVKTNLIAVKKTTQTIGQTKRVCKDIFLTLVIGSPLVLQKSNEKESIHLMCFPGSKMLRIITGTIDQDRGAKGTEELTHLPTVTEVSDTQ